MNEITRIHASKQPRRPHHISDWMEKRNVTAAELAKETGIDKSMISRWLNEGASPNQKSQEILAAFFQCERESLFRHPDDDWMRRFLRGRQREEIERMKQMLEAAFPPLADAANGTNGKRR